MVRGSKTSLRLIVLTAVLAIGLFVADVSLPPSAISGVPYVAVVLLTLWSSHRWFTLIVAMGCTALLIPGLLLNTPEGSLWQGLDNRAVAPFAIWITALLLYQYKRTEETLRDSEERYRAFVAQSFDAIWRFEFEPPIPITLPEDEQIERLYQNGYLAECNEVMAQMYGYSSVDELIGVRLEALMPRSEPDSIPFQRAFTRAGYRLVDEESHKVDPQGNSKIFLNNILGIIEDGRLVRTWGSQRDVTDRKQLEERLLQTQKMAAIGTLAGGIAHDFNNILAAILGFTAIALSDIAPNSQVRPHLQEVLRAGKRGKELVQQILTFSRQSEQRQQPVRLPELIREMLTTLQASLPATIEIQHHFDSGVGTVMADPMQMHQVLMNLFANAEYAMRASGGTLEVGLETVEVSPEVAARYPDLLPGRYVRLTVQDTGKGMTAEVRGRIFEPFYTTKQVGEGTGMGLAVVHGIVRHHNGTVTVESIPGQGTTFTLYLPCMPDCGETVAKFDTAGPQGHRRVLG
jgi:PAS domain S-box-containing protein